MSELPTNIDQVLSDLDKVAASLMRKEIDQLRTKLAAAEKVAAAALDIWVELTPKQRKQWNPYYLNLYDKLTAAIKQYRETGSEQTGGEGE